MTRPTALGAYVFAGGFALGVDQHFDIVAHVESGGDRGYGVQTFKRNFSVPVLDEPAGFGVGSVDLVYGNPPCAPWSPANISRKHDADHAGMELSHNHLALLGRHKPKVWIQECVPQLAVAGRDHVEKIAKTAADLGYSTTVVFHDGQKLGLAQRRKRLVVVCHSVELLLDDVVRPRVTTSEVLEGAPDWGSFPFPANWLDYAREAPLGKRVRDWIVKTGRPFPEGKQFRVGDMILDPDGVAPTLQGYVPPNQIHWDRDRTITLGEMGRLCGWPDDYSWAPKQNAIGDEMCRSIMPPVAEWIAGSARRSIDANRPVVEPAFREIALW